MATTPSTFSGVPIRCSPSMPDYGYVVHAVNGTGRRIVGAMGCDGPSDYAIVFDQTATPIEIEAGSAMYRKLVGVLGVRP